MYVTSDVLDSVWTISILILTVCWDNEETISLMIVGMSYLQQSH